MPTFRILLTSPNPRYRLRLANLVCSLVAPIEVAEVGTATLLFVVPDEQAASVREVMNREICPQGAEFCEEADA